MESDLDPAAVESAGMHSRGKVLELAMLESPEFAGCDSALFQAHLYGEGSKMGVTSADVM
jgi:hypothetical protein